MKLIKPRTFIIFAMLSLTGVALLHTSQSVRRAEKELSVLKASIDREEEKIRMLGAEWVHLNRPERLEKLASEFLELVPPKVDHILHEQSDEPVESMAQPVSIAPAKPPAKPPVRPAPQPIIQKEKTKDFGALLDELGADNKGGGQ